MKEPFPRKQNMDEKVKIVFDKEYKIRVLDPVKFEKGEALEKECANFVDKISSFNEKVNTLVDVLDLHASRIDAQKLRVRCRLRFILFHVDESDRLLRRLVSELPRKVKPSNEFVKNELFKQ